MIMVPVLIMQIFIFPFAATMMMDTWVDSRRELVLQETAGHLGSSIQQLYYTINRASISNGSLTLKLDTPPSIEGYAYTITLHNATNSNAQARIMNITLNLVGARGATSTLVTFGENAAWQDNALYLSNSTSINATKTSSGSILLSLEGGAYSQ